MPADTESLCRIDADTSAYLSSLSPSSTFKSIGSVSMFVNLIFTDSGCFVNYFANKY